MTITPVSPVNREKLVSDSTSITIDFTQPPVLVTVKGVTAYSSGIFQNGWTGSLFNTLTGKRLALTNASNFILGEGVEVYVEETGGATLTYKFQIGVTQITTTGDAKNPVVAITPLGQYVGYVRENGAMYVRFINPLSPEVQLIQATVVDIGYDPNLNKIVVFFINNDKVYVTTADPGDGPNSILPPGEASTPTKAVAYPYDDVQTNVVGGSGLTQSFGTSTFLPVKTAPPVDSVQTAVVGGSGSLPSVFSGFPRTITPSIISDNPRIIRIHKPSTQPEASTIVGFYVYKTSANYLGGRIISNLIVLPPGEEYVDFIDTAPTPKAFYAVICAYRNGQTSGLIESTIGGLDTSLAGNIVFAFDLYPDSVNGGSGSYGAFAISGTFLPVKVAVPLDFVATNVVGGSGVYQAFGR